MPDRTITLPLLTGNDSLVFNDFPATLTNKTLGSGSVFPASVVQNTQNNNLGDFYLDMGDIQPQPVHQPTMVDYSLIQQMKN